MLLSGARVVCACAAIDEGHMAVAHRLFVLPDPPHAVSIERRVVGDERQSLPAPCAISIRSNGSLCAPDDTPARCACSIERASPASHLRNACVSSSSARSELGLPRRRARRPAVRRDGTGPVNTPVSCSELSTRRRRIHGNEYHGRFAAASDDDFLAGTRTPDKGRTVGSSPPCVLMSVIYS